MLLTESLLSYWRLVELRHNCAARRCYSSLTAATTAILECLKNCETKNTSKKTELQESFQSVDQALKDPCEYSSKQPISKKHIALTTEARFRSAGYALMIEENTTENPVQTNDLCFNCIWLKSVLTYPTQKIKKFKIVSIYKWHAAGSHTSYERQTNRQPSTTIEPHFSSRQKQIHHHCGPNSTACYISK